MTAAAKPQADNNGAEVGAVVPSITDMISASVGTGNSEPTTLDDFAIRIDGLDTTPAGAAPAPSSDAPRRGRGRPRKDGSSAAPAMTTTAIAAPTKARKKSELAAELERVQSELAAERARRDENKIAELTKLVEMASYMGFGMAAAKRGPHWALTPEEAAQIGSSGAVVLAPYADMASKYMPGATFAAVLGHAIWTRVQIDEQRVAALVANDSAR